MKKRISFVLIGILCLLLLASCGTQDRNNSDPQETDAQILQKIDAANTDEALTAKYDKVAFRSTYTLADGEISSDYRYQDAERYVFECDYYMFIAENGDVYGFDNEAKMAYRYLFMDDCYVPFETENCLLAGFSYMDESEEIVSQEENDGVITIRTKIEDKSFVDDYAGSYLYENGSVSYLESEYKVDADTLELLWICGSVVLTDGTQKTIYECVRVSDPDTYIVDEQLKASVFEGERRTVTVTAYPGTEQEKVYAQTISRGNGISVYVPADSESALYTDPECTVRFVGDEDLQNDLQLYYK